MTDRKGGRRPYTKIFLWLGMPLFALAATALYVQTAGPGAALAQEAAPSQGAGVFSAAKVLGVLAFVFVLLFGVAFLARAYVVPYLTRQKTLQSMRVIESMMLTPKSRLVLVEIAQKLFVLGVTDEHVSLLHEFDDPDEIQRLQEARERPAPHSFQEYLQKLKQP